MALRNCDECGKLYEAKRSTSKYCGSTCRSAASVRGRAGKPRPPRPPAPPAPAPAPTAPTVLEMPPDPFAGEIERTTRAALDAASRTDTPLGAAALVIARRADRIANEVSGTAAAAVIKEHRAAVEAALQGAGAAVNPFDELMRRREQRRAAG